MVHREERWQVQRRNGIPTRVLGRTGAEVTVLGIGGHAICQQGWPEPGISIVRTAIDEGINFMDNAWCYHDGESEKTMGLALKDGYRHKVFLMTKNHGRDAVSFRRQLEESLRRLQTDYVDLLQFHEIVHDDEPQALFDQGAVAEAARARGEGKIRFIGFTGHRWPRLFRQMLDHDVSWDTVQMPTNVFDYQYRSFTLEILPLLKRRGIGVIGMKSLGGSGAPFLQSGITAAEAISWALSLPIDTLVSGIDTLELLRQNLAIVRSWQPLNEREKSSLVERVRPWARNGELEYYKTGWY